MGEMSKIVDMTGRTCGRLIVIALEGIRPGGAVWRCVCSCGARTVVRGRHLRTGDVKSCGCLQKERLSARRRSHGGSLTPEYSVWLGLRKRCFNKNDRAYKNYGGRGISICERWAKFDNFIADMGPRPSLDHSVERIDNNRGYSPDNCRWATRLEQASNTRRNVFIVIDGVKMSLAAASRHLGIKYSKLNRRLAEGWPVEKAIRDRVDQ